MEKILLIFLCVILFTSCLTPQVDPVTVTNTEEIKPVQETVEKPDVEPVIVEEVKPIDTFVVSEEEYDKTFDEIEVFITGLNKTISSGDFSTWQTLLSQSYIDKYGDSEYLQKLSDNPVLKDYGIKLKKLRDYFNYVVVPSRSNVVIDEIQFISEDKIKAFTFTNNDKFVVYLLIRTNNGWIISD